MNDSMKKFHVFRISGTADKSRETIKREALEGFKYCPGSFPEKERAATLLSLALQGDPGDTVIVSDKKDISSSMTLAAAEGLKGFWDYGFVKRRGLSGFEFSVESSQSPEEELPDRLHTLPNFSLECGMMNTLRRESKDVLGWLSKRTIGMLSNNKESDTSCATEKEDRDLNKHRLRSSLEALSNDKDSDLNFKLNASSTTLCSNSEKGSETDLKKDSYQETGKGSRLSLPIKRLLKAATARSRNATSERLSRPGSNTASSRPNSKRRIRRFIQKRRIRRFALSRNQEDQEDVGCFSGLLSMKNPFTWALSKASATRGLQGYILFSIASKSRWIESAFDATHMQVAFPVGFLFRVGPLDR
ncbi:hypothetical protein BCR39DRAFT_580409 [Naematelia encephala]|uniref:Uncharacterized protein n=1 Tax=Naematelia encephala TaxID=71784 RepID=A0A1Y2ARW6_9TREE|nr:hypothetical protein BCR39DRAFT_580409 [Naematelia encephala]